MNAEDFSRQLEEIANAGNDFEYQSIQLTERWKGDENTSEAVEPILRFMESHPDVDYGTPGALVHFVETFSSYEQKLVQSVEHRPTAQTVGMLNRVINGERDLKKRQALLATLERVLEHPQGDSMTRCRASTTWNFNYAPRQAFLNYPNDLLKAYRRSVAGQQEPSTSPHRHGRNTSCTGQIRCGAERFSLVP